MGRMDKRLVPAVWLIAAIGCMLCGVSLFAVALMLADLEAAAYVEPSPVAMWIIPGGLVVLGTVFLFVASPPVVNDGRHVPRERELEGGPVVPGSHTPGA